jgi:NADPH:quinone reductase-like Zn-dependent oxidoreductase
MNYLSSAVSSTGLKIFSMVTANGRLELSLRSVATVAPAENEVVVSVQASPLNPSDLGLLLGFADVSTVQKAPGNGELRVTATVPQAALKGLASRFNEPMAVGNEGAGVVVSAGAAPEAQALLGKVVAVRGGGMYAQFRTLDVSECLLLSDGITPEQGASCFVNPLTALGMVETMRREGHTALVHTAAASNVGKILNRICLKDGIALVNIVRSAAQVDALKELGAKYICDSTAADFIDQLQKALIETRATIAFDAVGGGKLVGNILEAMETAANANATTFSRYGSSVHKQAYIYGGLNTGPTEFNSSFSKTWSISGWLLTYFLQKISPADMARLRQRIVDELTTTFASEYTRTISLNEALSLEYINRYSKKATGEKYLINPSLVADAKASVF